MSASTETLRPNGNGDVTDLPYQYPDSGYHYDKVDDVSSDGDSTYVYRTVGTSDIYDLYSLSDHTGSGLINSVKIYIVVRVIAGQDCNFKIVIKTGGSVYKTNSIQHSTSTWTTYATEYTTNPQTGQAWTWAEIDSLQAGVGIICDWGEDGFCTQVYVVVDYTPNTTPSADTPTVQGYSSSPQKDHITDSTPTLGWTFNDNGDGDIQDGFEVEVWTGSGGTGTNMLDTGEQVSTAQSYTYDGSALSDGSTYYYRVKVKDSQGTWSDWSELSFTMNTEPTAPSLSSPADGSETTDTTPNLVVNNGTDSDGDILTYYFEIDTADTFDTADKQSSSGVSEGTDTTTWTVPNVLTDNTVWYWRCRSYDGYEYSSWMTTVSVVVNTANDSPNAFDLSSPADASTVTTTPSLIWEVTDDPDPNDTVTYTVEIDDTDSTFSSPEVTKTDLTS
ncbi:MAG: glycoside hydrolase family 78 protein, partial [Candidatus Thorarchaeota archaeon]